MSKLRMLVGFSVAVVFAAAPVLADEGNIYYRPHQAHHAAKHAKKPPAVQCKPYGDESAGQQMCGN